MEPQKYKEMMLPASSINYRILEKGIDKKNGIVFFSPESKFYRDCLVIDSKKIRLLSPGILAAKIPVDREGKIELLRLDVKDMRKGELPKIVSKKKDIEEIVNALDFSEAFKERFEDKSKEVEISKNVTAVVGHKENRLKDFEITSFFTDKGFVYDINGKFEEFTKIQLRGVSVAFIESNFILFLESLSELCYADTIFGKNFTENVLKGKNMERSYILKAFEWHNFPEGEKTEKLSLFYNVDGKDFFFSSDFKEIHFSNMIRNPVLLNKLKQKMKNVSEERLDDNIKKTEKIQRKR